MTKENPFYKQTKRKRSCTNFGRKAEVITSKRLGGKIHPGSGNMGNKGDFTVDEFKVENKSTIHETMKLELDWLRKVSQEAVDVGKTPALAIQFVNSNGKPKRHGNFVLVPEKVFKEIVKGYNPEED